MSRISQSEMPSTPRGSRRPRRGIHATVSDELQRRPPPGSNARQHERARAANGISARMNAAARGTSTGSAGSSARTSAPTSGEKTISDRIGHDHRTRTQRSQRDDRRRSRRASMASA